jgi:hypothetical protein
MAHDVQVVGKDFLSNPVETTKERGTVFRDMQRQGYAAFADKAEDALSDRHPVTRTVGDVLIVDPLRAASVSKQPEARILAETALTAYAPIKGAKILGKGAQKGSKLVIPAVKTAVSKTSKSVLPKTASLAVKALGKTYRGTKSTIKHSKRFASQLASGKMKKRGWQYQYHEGWELKRGLPMYTKKRVVLPTASKLKKAGTVALAAYGTKKAYDAASVIRDRRRR